MHYYACGHATLNIANLLGAEFTGGFPTTCAHLLNNSMVLNNVVVLAPLWLRGQLNLLTVAGAHILVAKMLPQA